MIEIDLHRTRDGEIVITHDEDLAGIGGSGEIADATLESVRALDAGEGQRVPTLDEAKAFLDSEEKNKRARLIDKLLDSEGYVSHFFNYWADVLRVNDTIGNNRLPSTAYGLWVKQALRRRMAEPHHRRLRSPIPPAS